MNITQGQLRQTFLELIKINSFYPDDLEVRDYVIAKCKQANVPYALDDFGNLIASLPGSDARPAVMLNTHMDIPEDTPKVAYRETAEAVVGAGQTILGADPKTGLAVLLELMLALSAEDPQLRAPVDFVFTRGEEQGLQGAHALDISKVRAREGLVIDEDGPASVLVVQATGSVHIEGTFEGKTAHPREPLLGINALQMAIDALAQIPLGYTDESKDVSWNVGVLNSGTASNSIPGQTFFKAEMRSFDNDKLHSEAERACDLFSKAAKELGGNLVVKQRTTATAYAVNEGDPLVDKMTSVLKEFSLEPFYNRTFGQSDANVFNQRGIHCIPVGSGYHHAHQYTETANLADMQTLAGVLAVFVRT